MEIIIIAAVEINGGLGLDNKMAWHCKEDMQFFKEQTTGHAVIMGRKTWESIGSKPLPNRANIVLSRSEYFAASSINAHSIEAALMLCRKMGVEKAFIIGGAQIYELAYPLATRVMLTKIERDFNCDTFMPDASLSGWKETKWVRKWSDSLRCYYVHAEYVR